MSSLFQANLHGNDFAQNPLGTSRPPLHSATSLLLHRACALTRSTRSPARAAEAAYYSKVTLKNMGYGGGLLHSHVQTMPVGSFQQQVTCYHYKDDNNHWTILPTWEADPIDPDGAPVFLQDGHVIRLLHSSTGRNLHSHAIIAPVSKQDYEVAGYGNLTIGDANDYWKVEVVDDAIHGRKVPNERIHSLTTRIRFRHVNLGCYLKAANVILPQWGFKQVEVSCDKENHPKDPHTFWNIESHWNDKRACRLAPHLSRICRC